VGIFEIDFELARMIVVPNSKGAFLKQISGVQDRVRLGAVLTKGALLPDACLKILDP
jgi:hypothetical protein